MNIQKRSDEDTAEEVPLDPAREIVDPHHHLWDHGAVAGVAAARPFLLQEFARVIKDSGHRITHSVYIECNSMYRREGPHELRCVGETEFANGMAAMSASGRYGDCRVAAGIVASANLRSGAAVMPILEAQVAAGNGRLKGIRTHTVYLDGGLFGRPADPGNKGIMLEPAFHEGVRALQRFGLTLDVWCLHTQLQELATLATACPEVTIVLDHLGTPVRLGDHTGRDPEVFAQWRTGIVELARRHNVIVKLSGTGMDLGSGIGGTCKYIPSLQLVDQWRSCVETCIEAFGTQRCMFGSNFPVDNTTCSYGALWNSYKLITAACSEDEKVALFSSTARSVYRLDH